MSINAMTDAAVAARHPARFNEAILEAMRIELERNLQPPLETWVLDPFAGVGRIHELRPNFCTVGVEIEAQWAAQAPKWTDVLPSSGRIAAPIGEQWNGFTLLGNALKLPFEDDCFDAIATSPCYGNRMADHHEARETCTRCKDSQYVRDGVRYIFEPAVATAEHGKSVMGSAIVKCPSCNGTGVNAYKRNTYTHALGRKLHDDNSGAMQWGRDYRVFHIKAWREAVRVLKPGGFLVLNVKDHIRNGDRQRVAGFHVHTLNMLGLKTVDVLPIPTAGLRHGANSELRVDAELLFTLQAR